MVLMEQDVQRHVAVKTMASATTPTVCVCVSMDTQESPVVSACALKDATASDVTGNVSATAKTLRGTQTPQSEGSNLF